MKRLSLLTLTIILTVGCQRSEANPIDGTQPTAVENGSNSTRLTSCYDADEWTCEVEAAIIRLTNEKRAQRGNLEQSFESSYVARLHSEYMGELGQINHDGFLAGNRTDALQKEFPGMKISYRAENVAAMSNSMVDPDLIAQEFVKMWWNSAGHRKNMEGNYRYIGVGVIRTPENGIYATQIFY
jgi:uncharacterized protein YkwD